MQSQFWVQTDQELIEETLSIDGTPVDLTGRSVETVFVHDENGRIDLDNEAEIVDAPNGVVRHQFTTADLNTPGNYTLEWVITGGPDDPTTVPKRYPVNVYVRGAGRLSEHAMNVRGIDAERIIFDGKEINPDRIVTREINTRSLDADSTTTDTIAPSSSDRVSLISLLDMDGHEIAGLGEPTDDDSAARVAEVNEVKALHNTHERASDAHHSRYTDEEVESVIEALTSLDIDVSGSASYAAESGNAQTLDGNPIEYFAPQNDFEYHEAQSGIHHTRYSDDEAVTAVNNEDTLNVNISGNAETAVYAEYADVVGDEDGMYIRDTEFNTHTGDENAHHERYTNFDAIDAVNNEDVLDVDITGNASTADHAETAGSLEGSGAGDFTSSAEFDDHVTSQDAHHSRYSNSEARSAIDGSVITPAEISSDNKYLNVSTGIDQDMVLNGRLGHSPPSGDHVAPLGWTNNFLYRAITDGRNITVSPNPSSGTIDNMFRPSGHAEWEVEDLPVSIEFELPESEVFAFYANSPTSERYAAENATLELRINGSWEEVATSDDGRPYKFDGFYENDVTHGRITFDGSSSDQQFFRIDAIAGYSESNPTNGLYFSREGGKVFGDIDMGGNNITNIGNGVGGSSDTTGTETIQASGEQEFRIDTGVQINAIKDITPRSAAASVNHWVTIDGSEIVIHYNIDQNDEMSWHWTVEGE